MDKPTCETCLWRGEFYLPPDLSVGGVRTYKCVRRAPVVTGGLHAPTMTVWPWVTLTDTCGEHKPKERDGDQAGGLGDE